MLRAEQFVAVQAIARAHGIRPEARLRCRDADATDAAPAGLSQPAVAVAAVLRLEHGRGMAQARTRAPWRPVCSGGCPGTGSSGLARLSRASPRCGVAGTAVGRRSLAACRFSPPCIPWGRAAPRGMAWDSMGWHGRQRILPACEFPDSAIFSGSSRGYEIGPSPRQSKLANVIVALSFLWISSVGSCVRRCARRPVSRVLSARRLPWAARDDHSSGTRLAARLTRPTRTAGRECPCILADAAVPIRSCSRWGLPCRPCCQGRGALLPHRFALARGPPCGACAGGLFSVALSLGSPPPAVNRHRIPVEPGLSSIRGVSRGQRPSGRLADGRDDGGGAAASSGAG